MWKVNRSLEDTTITTVEHSDILRPIALLLSILHTVPLNFSFFLLPLIVTRNSLGDEIANVNFVYDDFENAL